MSTVHLFRHGQAGLRDDYDTLSELGREQALRLGRHLAASHVEFRYFYSGGLRRQRETAAAIAEAYREAGHAFPEIVEDAQWNEFDLSAVYAGIAPQIAREDDVFRAEYEHLQHEMADRKSVVHRRWTNCDIAVVRAWVEGRYSYEGESWAGFRARVSGAFEGLYGLGSGGNIGVSTSATPIGVWMGLALELEVRYVLRCAGALFNSSMTSFRLRDGEAYVHGFNQIPHLPDAHLRTYR